MNKEHIEKAAKEYRMSLPYCDDPKIRGMSIGGYDGFIKGAEWRINSVWHRPNEKPENDRLVLCVRGRGGFALISGPNNSQFCKYSYEFGFEYWAYMSDLLPNGKEDAK